MRKIIRNRSRIEIVQEKIDTKIQGVKTRKCVRDAAEREISCLNRFRRSESSFVFSRESFRRRVRAARDLNRRVSRRFAARPSIERERDSDFATSH